MKPITNIDDARYVKAMSHPLRVRILALLDERTASPVELAGWLDATLGVVAYHVRTLERMGLIELVRETRVRGAVEHHYRSKERPRVSDEAWASAGPVAKQAEVGAVLQTVDDYARASAAAGGFDRAEAHLTRTSLRLDARGWQAAARACEKLLTELGRVQEASAKRLTKDSEAEGASDAALVLMLFETVKLSRSNSDDPASRPKPRRRRRSSAAAR